MNSIERVRARIRRGSRMVVVLALVAATGAWHPAGPRPEAAARAAAGHERFAPPQQIAGWVLPVDPSIQPTGTLEGDHPAAPPGSSPRNEPSVAVNPKNANMVITAANDYNGSGVNAGAYVSTDGGKTFVKAAFMYRAPSTDIAGDPALAYDSKGRAYFSYLDTNQDFTLGLGGMFVERSDDGGKTWPAAATKFASNSNTVSGGCVFQDKEYITVDRSKDPTTGKPRNWVYVSWTEYHLGGTDCGGFDSSPVKLVRSTNGAASFGPATLVSEVATDKTQGSIPHVARDGTLYVAYDSELTGMTDVCPTYSASTSGVTGGTSGVENIVVARSTNGGKSFTRTNAFERACDVPYPTPTGGTYRQNSIPTFDVNPKTGVLVVAWPNQDVSSQAIHVRVSTDKGKTWTDGQTLTGGPGQAYQFPWLAFGPNGTLYLTYLDQAPGGLFTSQLVTSTDNGKTWSAPVQLSTAQSHGDDLEFEGGFDGDYLGLAVGSDNVAHPVWTDIRSPWPTGTQNIWTRSYQA